MVLKAMRLGFAVPRSQLEIVDVDQPAARANSACVMSSACRSERMTLPGAVSITAQAEQRACLSKCPAEPRVSPRAVLLLRRERRTIDAVAAMRHAVRQRSVLTTGLSPR